MESFELNLEISSAHALYSSEEATIEGNEECVHRLHGNWPCFFLAELSKTKFQLHLGSREEEGAYPW